MYHKSSMDEAKHSKRQNVEAVEEFLCHTVERGSREAIFQCGSTPVSHIGVKWKNYYTGKYHRNFSKANSGRR